MSNRTRLMALSALSLVALVLGACAGGPLVTSALLTYESKPEGASLYEGGQLIGVAPVTRTYVAEGKSESIRTPLVTAQWPSGAKETYYTILPLGADRVATIERPAGAPGLQADLDNAKKAIAAREQEAKRSKEASLREIARNSERCRRQQSGASKAVQDDCS
jgi:hypothetical protein